MIKSGFFKLGSYRSFFAVLTLCGLSIPAFAQEAERKQARAFRIAPGAVSLDGRLDEEVWRLATPITDFIQKEPLEGAPPSDRTEVWFAYDDTAVYIAARMHTANNRAVQAPMSRRDVGTEETEHLLVEFDSYLDRRTAYGFGVSASGVRFDHFHSSDDERNSNSDFDPVWQARTSSDAGSWTAELWIPFSQLRFNLRDEQVWGLNVSRWDPLRNESSYWVAIPRIERGWSSRFGELRGVDGVAPPRRLEIMPYVAAGATVTGDRDARNPFDDGRNLEGRMGADLKVGFGSNLTLDVTVNPDFGQVEADPAVVNLSAFETFFEEKRPFFLEGTGTMSSRFGNYFYTRRIGAAPSGSANGDFVDYPSASTILGAAKLTGRLPSGTTVGFLGAVTASETAQIFDLVSATRGEVTVAPATTYGVGRVQQEFGPNTSTAAVMGTFVHRNVQGTSALGTLLPKNAVAFNADALLRFRGGEYELGLGTGFSHVNGSAGAIDRLQRSSARYFQRPDNTYTAYDPTRTSLTGGRADVSFQRREGEHWLFGGNVEVESPEFELNDLGRLQTADNVVENVWLQYRETEPGRWVRRYSIETRFANDVTFGGDRNSSSVTGNFQFTWANFWGTDVSVWRDLEQMNPRLTRGGPVMRRAGGQGISLEVDSSDAARTQLRTEWQYYRGDAGALTFQGDFGISFRPGARWQFEINPEFERSVDPRQFVTSLAGGRPETYGRRYVFAEIDRHTWSAELRANLVLKPDLTIDIYGEPFVASGHYTNFGDLAAPRTDALLPVAPIPGRDFNERSFRSNVVLRWEWRPGSTFFFVWQQNKEEEDPLAPRARFSSLFGSIGARGDQVLAVKASLWLAK